MYKNIEPRNVFANSFRELHKIYPITKINIVDIVKHSGLSRQTFYRYFTDIDNFIYYIHFLNVKPAYLIIENIDNSGFRFKLYLDLMMKNQRFYKQILSSHFNDRFTKAYFLKTKENYYRYLFKNNISDLKNSQKLSSSLDFYIHGTMGMIFEWIKGNSNYTSEYLSDILYNNRPSNLKSFY